MSVSWFVWVLSAAVLVSVVLLALVCLHCRNRGPLVSIRQANVSEEYMPSTEFRVIHPFAAQQNSDVNSIHLLSPFLPLSDPGTQRRQRSYTPTETESNPSYENPTDGPDYINTESDAEDPGYIIVLPEGETPVTNQSRASTPSSDVLHDYENVPTKKEEKDYLNVELLQYQRSTPDLSVRSDSTTDGDDNDNVGKEDDDGDDDETDSDDDEGNYVNVHEVTLTD
ncbi:linker for activation of T-cells family member 1 isoform X1 [Notothenia coriiceps]|uniref:Linker for activation of T-cells family member 1 isoform X1 n=1 Tax=Notothenia coriiceps TaxID=8208 RepID=A0A6I9PRY0_9TELE|nr:PREDICTED: calsequestrin-1-like isoform X1 [Notothenia coriiceps]